MTANSPTTLSSAGLAGLTVAVLLTHIILLQAAPLKLGLTLPQPKAVFTTRVIDAAPNNPASAKQRADPAAVAPRKAAPTAPDQTKLSIPATTPSSGDALRPPPAATATTNQPGSDLPRTDQSVASQPARPTDAGEPPADPGSEHYAGVAVKSYTPPGSVRLRYKVDSNKVPFSVNAELLWLQDGEHYQARLEIGLLGFVRVQTSRGDITPQGLAPVRFADKLRSEVAAHFNRAKKTISFSANTPDVPLMAGAQDRLSVMMQLAAMIAGDPAYYPQGSTISFQVIGPRDAETWVFSVGSEEKLMLPGGEQVALKLERNPRRKFDQRVELWMAPELGYLPARVRITESNGDFVDQKWLSTEPQT